MCGRYQRSRCCPVTDPASCGDTEEHPRLQPNVILDASVDHVDARISCESMHSEDRVLRRTLTRNVDLPTRDVERSSWSKVRCLDLDEPFASRWEEAGDVIAKAVAHRPC